ncbi:hypothetical protein GH714_022665 [Hevea brasiliensis]|uniref:Uncharacterized protein n=1 Tax=Hevea brasiliensis TaxID=3981 RepID=A0A6A6NIN7_HEVBR|nr:hypothetical protein GH714_022665 [Hevea brasiliensis]
MFCDPLFCRVRVFSESRVRVSIQSFSVGLAPEMMGGSYHIEFRCVILGRKSIAKRSRNVSYTTRINRASESFVLPSSPSFSIEWQCKAEHISYGIEIKRLCFQAQRKVERNRRKLESDVSQLILATSRRNALSMGQTGVAKMNFSRIGTPLCKYSGFAHGSGDKDYINGHEVIPSTSARLPFIEKIPPYTTWIFLDSAGIRGWPKTSQWWEGDKYYDQHGSEALICSDSEEDIVEPEEEKHEFSEGEDRIIWMVFQEHGLAEEVLNIISQFIGVSTSEIQRASFDRVKSILIGLNMKMTETLQRSMFPAGTICHSEHASGPSNLDTPAMVMDNPEHMRKRKVSQDTNDDSTQVPDLQDSASKKQKKLVALDILTENVEDNQSLDDVGGTKSMTDKSELQLTTKGTGNDPNEHALKNLVCFGTEEKSRDEADVLAEVPELNESSSTERRLEGVLSRCEWKPIEKELYSKGLEIFGQNSCLIAGNLLSGLKTCMEVSNYMCDSGATMTQRSVAPSSILEDNGKNDTDYMEQEMPTRSRLLRRRGRTRKLKYSFKSAGHPSIWKRIADGKNQSSKQYTPCGCQSMCGKQCPCLHNGTCCEKYCGCSKSCKNRFRGCHCAKSQCRSRQCPCFAAGRECDPDVCRNCWVSCGDGSLGEPPKRGDGQCGNMRLLLRQQHRILLAKSEVAGWGAFSKNPVNKNDYLGEYTGELISHREADKRGKIYDRANSSFLFDLNDQYVLDAYRKGDKLKFANHSSNPNCYAKERIEASEELFYDYRYGPDQAPAWARKPEGPKRDDSTVSQVPYLKCEGDELRKKTWVFLELMCLSTHEAQVIKALLKAEETSSWDKLGSPPGSS